MAITTLTKHKKVKGQDIWIFWDLRNQKSLFWPFSQFSSHFMSSGVGLASLSNPSIDGDEGKPREPELISSLSSSSFSSSP